MRLTQRSISIAALLVFGGCYATCGSNYKHDIEARLKSAQEPLSACYASALERNRDAQGDVVVGFQTEPNTGRFKKVKVVQSAIKDPEFEGCITKTVSSLKLKKASLQTLEMKYPIAFVALD